MNLLLKVCWWWRSLVVVVCLRKYFILFLICTFLRYRILSQLYFSQHLRWGASVLWLTLFHLPNLLSSPFFVLLCLFLLLVTFILPFTSCGIPFTHILTLLKLLQISLMHNKFFPQSLHVYLTCLYLTYSIFFSFMNIRINDVVSILMPFPANYVMYILTVFLLIDFSLIMDIFLLLYTSEMFFCLNVCIYLN